MHDRADTSTTPKDTDRTRGATAVEYAILGALIAAVIAATVTLVGLDTLGAFSDFSTAFRAQVGP